MLRTQLGLVWPRIEYVQRHNMLSELLFIVYIAPSIMLSLSYSVARVHSCLVEWLVCVPLSESAGISDTLDLSITALIWVMFA